MEPIKGFALASPTALSFLSYQRSRQVDFHAGFGLNRASIDYYFGVGYSFRLDGLFGGSAQNAP
jgi:hypothetical protein